MFENEKIYIAGPEHYDEDAKAVYVRMKEKVPNLGVDREYRYMTGANLEDFNYPVNLMFACSMDIMEGRFEDVIAKIAEVLHQKEER